MRFKPQMSWTRNLLSHKRRNGPPLGLRNLGNTCYLNSVLQCLTYTPPLANFCLTRKHSSHCDSRVDGKRKRDCAFCIVEKRITRSLSVDLATDAPKEISSCLKIFAKHFKFGRQEDAHEFLMHVIDACHNTSLRLNKLRIKGSEPFNGNTVMKDIFGGALQSQVKCLSCGVESDKTDEIMDISLEIFHSKSVMESMQKFFQSEILDGNNKYRCENCKELVKAKKQMGILQAPNILVIQLKRFKGKFGEKIDKAISFGETLVLSSFMSKTSKDPQPEYKLFGIIVHSGISADSGHYYAYVKDSLGQWYCCDDSDISNSTLQKVLSKKAYILFFSRSNQRPVSAKTLVTSDGTKSHEVNSCETSKSHKFVGSFNGVHMKPEAEQSFQKNNLASSKPHKFKFIGPLKPRAEQKDHLVISKVENAPLRPHAKEIKDSVSSTQSKAMGSSTNKDPCILLRKDKSSRDEVEKIKESLKKDASAYLRSCGWYDKVLISMRAKKRMRTEQSGGDGEDINDLKRRLIEDVRSNLISQIPEGLKADLVNRIWEISK